MSYVTQDDLVARFGEEELVQLTDRVNRPPETIDAAVVGKAIADASSFIDGYIGGRYSLPLVLVPHSLVKAGADIARKFLHGDAASELIQKDYDKALKFLGDIAAGKVTLDVGAGNAAGDGSPAYTTPVRHFDPDDMAGF